MPRVRTNLAHDRDLERLAGVVGIAIDDTSDGPGRG
jgi:hypothetical protein